MTRIRRVFLVASLALTVTLPRESALAQAPSEEPPEPTSYAPLIDAAVAEFAAGRWAEARALFRSAHELFPNARTLRGIGMASYELRDYPAAVRALAASLESPTRPLTDEQRAQVSALLDRTRAFVGRFVVPAAPPGSRLYLDGSGFDPESGWPEREAELIVGVGEHEVTIRTPEGRSAHARFIVRGREDQPLDIDTAELAPRAAPTLPEVREGPPLPSEPPQAPAPAENAGPAPWIIAASGGVAIVAGAVLLGLGLHDESVVENAGPGTEWSELAGAFDRAPALTASGAALIGIGTAAAIGGIVWGSLADAEEDRRAAVALRIGVGALSIEGDF